VMPTPIQRPSHPECMCEDTTKETAKNPGDQIRQKKIVIRRNRVCFALEERSGFGCYPASGVLR